MPELPEVETVCRGLKPILEGQRIARLTLRRKDMRIPFPQGLAQTLTGHRVMRIARRAKLNDFHRALHGGQSHLVADDLGGLCRREDSEGQ